MGILSLKEFGLSMGMSYDTVKKNAQRGNIVKGTDGKIDTENPVNKLFYENEKLKQATKPTKEKEVKSESKPERVNSQTKEQKIYVDLDLRKRRAETEAKERENELKRMNLEKAAGNLLPVDLVERILIINIQAVFKNFDVELENIASIYVDRFGGNRKDLVEITTKQRDILSLAITRAKAEALHEIENAVNVFQDQRGRGQR